MAAAALSPVLLRPSGVGGMDRPRGNRPDVGRVMDRTRRLDPPISFRPRQDGGTRLRVRGTGGRLILERLDEGFKFIGGFSDEFPVAPAPMEAQGVSVEGLIF